MPPVQSDEGEGGESQPEPQIDAATLTFVADADPSSTVQITAATLPDGRIEYTPAFLPLVSGSTYTGSVALFSDGTEVTDAFRSAAEWHLVGFGLLPSASGSVAPIDVESEYGTEDENGGDYAVGLRFRLAVAPERAEAVGTLPLTLFHFEQTPKGSSSDTSSEIDLRLDVPVSYQDPPAFVAPELLYDAAYSGPQADRRTVDVYVPQGAGPFPLVAWVHGGGYTRVALDKGYNVAEFLQANGYTVALIGYRLVDGSGQLTAFDAMDDYMDAIAYVVEEAATFRVDPNQIVLMGHSSGGGMATRAAVNPYWVQSVGLSLDRIALCVPIDEETGWNIERAVARARATTEGSAETLFGVVRDSVPEPDYAAVGVTANAQTYPIGTPLYDHPTVLYPDLQGKRHPQNLSVLYDISPTTPPHWIPYTLRSLGRREATAEFVAAMRAAGRPAATLELVDTGHTGMKTLIGRYDRAEAIALSDGLLNALADATRSRLPSWTQSGRRSISAW